MCVISYGFWQRRFGGDRNVIGRNVQIGGRPFTVLGVTPRGFVGFNQGVQTDISVPLMADAQYLQTFGGLRPSVSAAQAQSSLDVLFHQFETRRPLSGKLSKVKILLEPGSQGLGWLRRQYERPLMILMVVVGLVLLIACANISNLLMARATGRTKRSQCGWRWAPVSQGEEGRLSR